MRFHARRAIGPGVALRMALAFQKPFPQQGARAGIRQSLPHMLDADPFHPMRGAFEVPGLFPIDLHEGGGPFQHFAIRSVTRTLMPPFPATWMSHPLSVAMTPKSLIVASAQFRGQPDTAILVLCGVQLPQVIFSRAMPIAVESCVPKRHHSEPTQVLTVRNALP